MKLNIAVLPGDGIGPEIAAQGVEVMSAVCKKFGHEVRYEYALCGADAIDKVELHFGKEDSKGDAWETTSRSKIHDGGIGCE